MKNKRKFILLTLAIIIIESSLLVKGRELLNIFSSIDIIFKEEVQQGAVPVMRYHSINQAFEDDKTIKGEVKKNITSFSLKSIGNKSKVWFELSPNIKNNFFSITKIQIRIGGFIVKEYNTDVLQNDFFDIYNIDSSEYKKDEIIFHTEDKDPYIVFTLGFQSKPHILIVCFIFMIWLIVSFVLLGHGEINNRYISRLLMITGIFFTMLGGILWVFKAYLVERYGDLPIFQLIFYHLNEPLKGTNLGQFKDLYYRIGKISCLLICVIGIGYFIFKFIDRKSFFRINLFLGGSFLLVFALEQLCTSFDLIDYFQYIKEETDIYDTYFVDPKTVSFEFENKRNLIYIFVESMEISFADKQMGGYKGRKLYSGIIHACATGM